MSIQESSHERELERLSRIARRRILARESGKQCLTGIGICALGLVLTAGSYAFASSVGAHSFVAASGAMVLGAIYGLIGALRWMWYSADAPP